MDYQFLMRGGGGDWEGGIGNQPLVFDAESKYAKI